MKRTGDKLLSIALSLLLMAGAYVPAAAQTIATPWLHYVDAKGNIEKRQVAGYTHIVDNMSESFDLLAGKLTRHNIDLHSQNITLDMYDKAVRQLTANHIKALEANMEQLKQLGPEAFKYASKKYFSNGFRLFAQNAQAGLDVREAFVKSFNYPPNASLTEGRMYNLYDFASGKKVSGLLSDEFLKNQIGKLDYDDLLRSFDNSASAIVKVKKDLQTLGISNKKLQAAVLAEISNRTAIFSSVDEAAKRNLALLDKHIAYIKKVMVFYPSNNSLLVQHNNLHSKKALELKTIRENADKITKTQAVLAQIYKEDPGFRNVVDGMATSADKNLFKKIPSLNIGAGAFTLILIVVGAYAAFDTPGAGAPKTASYDGFIKHQREVVKIIDNAPSLLPIMYSNADAAGKKMLANLSYKDDYAALNTYLANTAFADEINGISAKQLSLDIAAAKKMLAAEEQAKKIINLEGYNERLQTTGGPIRI